MLQFLLTMTDESNHERIERIYKTYHDYMVRYAVSRLRSAGRRNFGYDAEDAVQNAFMKITLHIDNIDFSRGERDVKSYCFTILSNEIYNILNDREEICELNEEICCEETYSFVEELEIKERYSEVVRAIEGLDEKYGTTLYLVFCQEKRVNEIAEMMGLTPKTVYTRLYRGKELLLNTLKGARING